MTDKHLLLTIMSWGYDIIEHPGLELKNFNKNHGDLRRQVTEGRWSGEVWETYKKVGGRFSVLNGMTIHLHKDNNTSLRDYNFAVRKTELGFSYPHWTFDPISIDNPRHSNGKYIQGLESKDIFENPKFGTDVISFDYTGKSEAKSGDGTLSHSYFIPYDIYLVKQGSQGFPVDEDYIWIGPIIRNDGGPP